MKYVLAIFVGLGFGQTSFAKDPPSDKRTREILQSFAGLVGPDKKVSRFLDAIKTKISAEDHAFLVKKAASILDQRLPKATVVNDNTLRFDTDDSYMRFEVVSAEDRIFKVNGHELDFSNEPEISRRWMLVEEALAAGVTRGPLLRMLVPEAHAIAPLVLAGYLGSLIATSAAAYMANDYNCSEMRDVVSGCVISGRRLKEMLEEQHRREARLHRGQPGSRQNAQCPPSSERDVHMEQAIESNYRSAINIQKTTRYNLPSTCSEEKRTIKECVSLMYRSAKRLCLPFGLESPPPGYSERAGSESGSSGSSSGSGSNGQQ